jgi:hypothetical protein
MTTLASQADQNEPDPSAAAPPLLRRRFQFSLATLLWLTTLVACVAALGITYRNLRETKRELQTARSLLAICRVEMGYLDVSDPKKIYARGLRTMEPYKWSWRIYLPKKLRFKLHASIGGIPYEAVPSTSDSEILLMPGEHLIDVSAIPSRDEKWKLHIKLLDGPGADRDMPSGWNDGCETVGVFETKQEVVDSNSPLVLLRLRRIKNVYYYQPCNGLMIWIEEAKP